MARPPAGAARLETVRAVLFDFDGTLVEQRVDFARMRREALAVLAAHGVDPAPLAGMHVLEMVERAGRELVERDPLYGAQRAQALAADARRAIEEVECEGASTARALPGAAALLGDLRARGVGVAIVTRNCRAAVERVLARHALEYDVLLTRDDVPHVKPDPRHLQAALDRLGVPGEDAAMCGDHPMDIAAGRGVGAWTVGVLPEGQGPEYMAAAAPDLLVAGVAELRAPLGLGPAGGERR
jgi:phosphoglycolate phosphatase